MPEYLFDYDEEIYLSECDSETTYDSSNSRYNIYHLDLGYPNDSDEILGRDAEHLESDKIDKKYYLGLYEEQNHDLLLSNSISIRTYFQYNHCDCLAYLYWYGISPNAYPEVQIMQLNIQQDGTYSVLVKTFWIKIIQRKWRNVLAKRRQIIHNRLQTKNILNREQTGKWKDYNYFPTLFGMLA